MSEPTRRTAPAALRPLAGIREPIFVHAPHARVSQVAALCADDLLGAVYTMPKKGNRMAALGRVLTEHRAHAGESATVIADANQYHGNNRRLADQGLELPWVQQQLDAGLPWALTDSGYVERDQLGQLQTLFRDGAELVAHVDGSVLLAIPAEYRWVKERADELRGLIDSTGIPYALILGASSDPLGSVAAAQGLRHVFQSPVPGVLLRTDMSAIAAVAAGAGFGAIGTSSSLRHIYPAGGHGNGRDVQVSALLPQGLSYQRLDIMAAAAALSPAEPYWACGCEGCQGGRVDQHVVTDRDAFAHSVRGALEIAREVLRGSTLNDNLKSFRSRALSAQFIHMDIQVNVESWKQPASLGAWVGATSDL